jgi:hypothetical protein
MANGGTIIPGPPPFGRIPQLHPTGNALIEHSEVAIPLRSEFFVGQTGQLVWTGSIEDHQPVTGDLPRTRLEAVQGNRQRAFDVADQIVLAASDID